MHLYDPVQADHSYGPALLEPSAYWVVLQDPFLQDHCRNPFLRVHCQNPFLRVHCQDPSDPVLDSCEDLQALPVLHCLATCDSVL